MYDNAFLARSHGNIFEDQFSEDVPALILEEIAVDAIPDRRLAEAFDTATVGVLDNDVALFPRRCVGHVVRVAADYAVGLVALYVDVQTLDERGVGLLYA